MWRGNTYGALGESIASASAPLSLGEIAKLNTSVGCSLVTGVGLPLSRIIGDPLSKAPANTSSRSRCARASFPFSSILDAL